MRFRIYRSSDYGYFYETPPCKNAVVVEEQEPINDKFDADKSINRAAGDI